MSDAAASYSASSLATESIVSAFGTGLATTTQVATAIPLPASLTGTTVKIKDSAGAERLAPLFFVSSGQINYQIPPGTTTGTATVTITSGDGSVSIGTVQIAAVAPGLFTFNSDGQGVPAGYVLRYRNGIEQPSEPIAQLDAQNKWVPRPIDLGPESDQIFLVLFGTGIRFRTALSTVTAKIRGADAEVLYAGPAPGFVGLDQINLRLLQGLIGRGEVDVVLIVDSQMANLVKVNIR